MKHGFIKLGAAVPHVRVAAPMKNAAEICRLIDRAYEVEELFYGEGLPYDDPQGRTPEELLATAQSTIERQTMYLPVSADAKYQSKSEMLDLARSVYADKVVKGIEEAGFGGSKDANGVSIIYARYIEHSDGPMTVNIESIANPLISGRTFDTSTLKIVRKGPDYVVVSADAYTKDGKPDGTKEFTVYKETDGWRLGTNVR